MTLTAFPGSGTPAADELPAFRVVLVDGHCIFRQALRILLAADKDFAVVGEAGRAGEALELIGSLQADLVLTDLHLPDGRGVQFIEQVRTRFPKVAILVLTALRARGAAAAARKAGALGYVLKDQGRAELSSALREVAAGRWYCSDVPAAMSGALRRAGSSSSTQATYLTERQRQVLRSVALGHSAREIAGMLGVSVKAVHKQRERLRFALQLNSTAALTRFAVREGLVQESPPSG
jgi:two-component system NarL family response regulator